MKDVKGQIEIFYKQFAVFKAAITDDPFPFWTDAHVRQGFAWRPESAGFATPRDGTHMLDLGMDRASASVSQSASRIIEVPFDIAGDSEPLEIATTIDNVEFFIPEGNYTLRYEYFDSEPTPAIRLTFTRRSGPPRFAIVKADAEMTVKGELVLSAEPA